MGSLAKAKSLVLAATPLPPGELRTIFSDKQDGIKRALEVPPSIRESGWGLRTSSQAQVVRGELIRVQSHRASLDLYRDGTLLFAGRINQNFLAWSDRNDLTIHPLALVEVISNFTRFYGLVISDLRATPESILFSVTLKHLNLGGQSSRLPSGPVGKDFTWLLYARHLPAPADSWTSGDIIVPAASFDPEQVAYRLVREIYLWFGHSEEDIPYLKDMGDSKAVDTEQIVATGR